MAKRTTLIEKLRKTTTAVSITKMQFGRRRSWDAESIKRAASEFGCDAAFISGSKKLLDYSNEKYRAVASIMSQATLAWKAATVPHPEPGVRLIQREKVGAFEDKMKALRVELNAAVEELDAAYPSMKEEAKSRLKDLYDETNYPASMVGVFGLEWSYPNLTPPEYLKDLNPGLYEQELRRVQARFDEAITMAEQAFVDEFKKAVASLADRLEPQDVFDYWYEGPTKIEIQTERRKLWNRANELEEQVKAIVDQDGDSGEAESLTNDRREVILAIDDLNLMEQLCEASEIELRNTTIRFKPEGGKKTSLQFDTQDAAKSFMVDMQCNNTGSRMESKKIQDSSIDNLAAFFDRFSDLSIGSNDALEELVEKAKNAVTGVTGKSLRDADVKSDLRAKLQDTMGSVLESLDAMTIDDNGGRNIDFGGEE